MGDAPGSLRASTIESPILGGLLPLTSSSANDEFVPVGAKRVTFRYRQQLSLESEWKAREKAGPMSSDDSKAGRISIMIVENDVTERLAGVDIPIGRLVELENERMGEDPTYGQAPGNAGEP